MEQVCDLKDCSGCGACAQICPAGAVTMKEDKLANLIPQIDTRRCINCGLCTKKCHIVHGVQLREPVACYAAIAVDEEIYTSTSSGGVATVFSQEALRREGCVYGAAFEAPDGITHIRAINNSGLERLKGSKYVFSRTDGVYSAVQNDLKQGGFVLFIGTPCQVAGLKQYLDKEYDSLVTVDLICHGTPPAKYLSEHIRAVSGVSGVTDLSFRAKDWCLTIHKGKRVAYRKKSDEDSYFSAFLKGLTFRNNCYRCRYAKIQRCADITIGDFWGLGHTGLPEKSKSVVLINTGKGMAYWNAVSGKVQFEHRAVEEAVRGNSQLSVPSQCPPERNVFESVYQAAGFEVAMAATGIKKCCRDTERKNQRTEIVRSLKKAVKRALRLQ